VSDQEIRRLTSFRCVGAKSPQELVIRQVAVRKVKVDLLANLLGFSGDHGECDLCKRKKRRNFSLCQLQVQFIKVTLDCFAQGDQCKQQDDI